MERYVEHMICPKCGSSLVTTDYDKEKDVMVRDCSNCRWSTNQLPLDKVKGE